MTVSKEHRFPIPNQLYINGKLIDGHSEERYSLYNPADETLVSDQVQYATEEDIDAAVTAAEIAFRGPWKNITATERGERLLKFADLLVKHKEELAWLDSLPTGKPVGAHVSEIEWGASIIRYYAGWTDKYAGESYPADDGLLKIVRHEPLGVCVGINAWNGPLSTLCFKLGPCLATGNVMIIKPSEKSPFGATRVAQLATEAGIFPPGVLQSLPGAGFTGALLASHMGVRKISFTGSLGVGRLIQQAAAKSNLKRVTLELGGKSPAGIFEDCNLDNAIFWASNAITQNSGQVCVAASRLYVQESIADEFIERFVAVMKEKTNGFGDHTVSSTILGPLVDRSHFDRVSGFLERDGGKTKVLAGGRRHGTRGYFWEPTILYNPDPQAEVYKQEIFGPVVCIRTFKEEADFLVMANNTEFGLMSGVFTQDINRAIRVSAQLDSGVVGINCVSQVSVQAPFGGSKQSGIGREMGHFALRSYTETKTLLINMMY